METNDSWKSCLFDWGWFLAVALASSAWCLLAAATVGYTFDEQPDLDNALDFWRTGSHYQLLRVGAMPLPMDLAALPIYLRELHTGVPVHFSEGDHADLLFQARAMTLIFWWLLLFYARRVARLLGGPWAGRLATAFIACEPNFLAHASLATKDIAVSACLLAFVFHFARGREAGWWKRIGLPSLWFALALLSKASALTFAPICMLAIELQRLWTSGAWTPGRRASEQAAKSAAEADRSDAASSGWWTRVNALYAPLRPFVRDGIGIGSLGLLITFLYCGSDWQVEPSWVRWAHGLPDGAFKTAMVWLAENTKIFSNAGVALAKQVSHNIRGHGVYILGQSDPRAIWYYFPVALAIKLALPLLLLPALLVVVRPRSLGNWACVAAAVLLLYSLNCRVQIGIRLMLPVVALAVAGLAASIAHVWHATAPLWKKRLLTAYCGLGLSWMTAATIHVWPNGLCYTNEAWGGTETGYLCLSDSNYDWGQGVPELERWRRQHASSELALWYFGTDARVKTMPISVLPDALTRMPPEQFENNVRGRYLAVSTTILYGSYTPDCNAVVTYLRSLRPADRTQTFLIYDFTAPERHALR